MIHFAIVIFIFIAINPIISLTQANLFFEYDCQKFSLWVLLNLFLIFLSISVCRCVWKCFLWKKRVKAFVTIRRLSNGKINKAAESIYFFTYFVTYRRKIFARSKVRINLNSKQFFNRAWFYKGSTKRNFFWSFGTQKRVAFFSVSEVLIGVVGNNWLFGWLVGWLVGNAVFLEKALRVFLIFCMKLGDYKGRKVAEPDFWKKILIWRYSQTGLQISPKSDTLIILSKTAPMIFWFLTWS